MTLPDHRGGEARRASGLTLIEMLIGVVLLALLMAAIGAATHASLTSYRENADVAALNQTSQLLLVRLRREIRTAEAVDHQAPWGQLVIYPPPNDEGLERITYAYDGGAKTLTYSRQINGATTSQVVLDGSSPVQLNSFYAYYDVVPNDQGVDCTRRAFVAMDFEVGGKQSRVLCTASPRRNLQY